MAQTLKIVKQDTIYETVHSYITDSSKSVTNYEEMIEVVLDMIKEGYCFLMDRDILRDALESLTYMYEPNDDMNKDRVILQLVDVDDDEDDDDEGDAGMDMLKNLGKMMGMPDMSGMGDVMNDPEEKSTEDTPAPEEKPVEDTPAPEEKPVEDTPAPEEKPVEDTPAPEEKPVEDTPSENQ